MRRLLPILSLLFLAFYPLHHCYGQAIEVDRNFEFQKLDRIVDVWQDTSKSAEFEDVISSSVVFEKFNQNTLNFGYQDSYFWIRFEIVNRDSILLNLILEIENPHINKIRLFQQSMDTVSGFPLTGDNTPFATRQIAHPHFLFPVNLKPGQPSTFYLWIDKHGEQVQCPLKLSSTDSFSVQNTELMVFWGILIGILSLFVFLSAMIFVLYNRRISFYYLGYSVSAFIFLVAHAGLGFQYLWSTSTWWQSAARPSMAISIYIFYLLFTRSFFAIRSRSKALDIFTKFVLAVLIIHLSILLIQSPFLGLIEHYWYHPEYYSGTSLLSFQKSMNLTALTVIFSVFLIGMYFLLIDRRLEYLWFVLSAAMLLIAGTSTLFVFSGVLPANLFTKNLPLISTSAETFVLALLLANRWRTVYKDNARISAELIAQRAASARNLIEGQLQERKRLSQQLHDGISTTLANIRLRLSIFNENAKSKTNELIELEKQLERTGKDVRQISHDLSPVLLERYGLIPALEELIEVNKNANPGVGFHFDSNGAHFESVPEFIQKNGLLYSQRNINQYIKTQ